MKLPDDGGIEFIHQLQQHTAKIICDGLFKWGKSSSAFLSIADDQIIGTNMVPGRKEDQSAYRGESGGILGSIIAVKLLCDKFHVTAGTVTIGCDCEGAVKTCENTSNVSCRWKCYDVVSRIQHQIRGTTIKFVFRHISGHQDAAKAYDELDKWEKANAQSDTLAKEALRKYVREGSLVIDTSIQTGDKWIITLDKTQITVLEAAELTRSDTFGPLEEWRWR